MTLILKILDWAHKDDTHELSEALGFRDRWRHPFRSAKVIDFFAARRRHQWKKAA